VGLRLGMEVGPSVERTDRPDVDLAPPGLASCRMVTMPNIEPGNVGSRRPARIAPQLQLITGRVSLRSAGV